MILFAVSLLLTHAASAQLLRTISPTKSTQPVKGTIVPRDPWEVYDAERQRYDELDQNVTCPALPKRLGVKLPAPPYDLARGDCALRGRSEEVEAYLQALERMAAGCAERRESAWQAVLSAREDLDEQIDGLQEAPERPSTARQQPEPEAREKDSFGLAPMSLMMDLAEPAPSMCPLYSGSMEPLEPSEPIEPEDFYYGSSEQPSL